MAGEGDARDGFPRLRSETAEDRTAIHSLHTAAFERSDEADLVDRLRLEGAVRLSIVADADGEILGHVLFSALVTDPPCTAVALAPVAVLPARQGAGIGTALIVEGLERCREAGADLVVVLGDPAYYGRFGFSSALGSRLSAPYEGEALMALELRPGALGEGKTRIRYAEAFGTT
jgi:putative acetyltransferase